MSLLAAIGSATMSAAVRRSGLNNASYIALDPGMLRLVGDAVAHRHENNVIVPLFANAAALSFLKNLLCSIGRLKVQNWLAVSFDNATCHGLSERGFLPATDPEHACVEPYARQPLDAGAYGSPNFWRLVVQRPLWIRWLLTQGYSVLQCDVDIVWLRNPLAYVASRVETVPPRGSKRPPLHYCGNPASLNWTRKFRMRHYPPCHLHNASLILQSEAAYGYNCGFYFIRPSNATVQFMDKWMGEMLHPSMGRAMHEQHAMLFTLGNTNSKTARGWMGKGMQIVRLDEALFPTGKQWFEQWHVTRREEAYIVHSNWVHAGEQKKLRLRRDNLWFLDADDNACAARFEPMAGCASRRRCNAVGKCPVGRRCGEFSCRSFVQRALTDLARSIRFHLPFEDRWDAMAWSRVCRKGNEGIGVYAGRQDDRAYVTLVNEALDRAALLLAANASARRIFAIDGLTDITGRLGKFGRVQAMLFGNTSNLPM